MSHMGPPPLKGSEGKFLPRNREYVPDRLTLRHARNRYGRTSRCSCPCTASGCPKGMLQLGICGMHRFKWDTLLFYICGDASSFWHVSFVVRYFPNFCVAYNCSHLITSGIGIGMVECFLILWLHFEKNKNVSDKESCSSPQLPRDLSPQGIHTFGVVKERNHRGRL